MDTTYTDVTAGVRLAIEVEFVSRRVLDAGDGRVDRLLVADRTGEQFAVLVAPTADPLYGLRTGGRYRIEGLQGRGPPRSSPDASGAIPVGGDDQGDCRVDDAVARAADSLGLAAPFGVVDERSSLVRVRSEVE